MGAERRIVQKHCFSWENAMTIKFRKCKLYFREISLSLRRLLKSAATRVARQGLPAPVWNYEGTGRQQEISFLNVVAVALRPGQHQHTFAWCQRRAHGEPQC